MADLSAINNIYNYYLTTYAPRTDSRYDTHKKSELRGVYNSIIKMNKEAPLVIVDRSQETKEYAVGLKENARAFRNTIASLGGMDDSELLDKKVAYSSNESLASATYIGEDLKGEGVPSFTLGVDKLASNQVNVGKSLPGNSIGLPQDTYSFDIGISGLNYEFQYNVAEGDTNRSIQDKLARLITNSNIGLTADVVNDGEGRSSLRIASNATGSTASGLIFNVSEERTGRTKGSISYFGLDNVAVTPSDAEFTINGVQRRAKDNTFTVQKQYEINLHRVSGNELDTTRIELQEDMESLVSNIESLIEGYNAFIDVANKYAENHPKAGRLINEMKSLAESHAGEFEDLGLKVEEDAHITMDRNVILSETNREDIADKLVGLKNFAGSMLRKANQVSIDPMHYADTTIVAYKNPGHNFTAPYVTSAYTGMMFNSYC